MDETPLFLNMERIKKSFFYMERAKKIDKIGSNTVIIKTHGQDKVRVTAIY